MDSLGMFGLAACAVAAVFVYACVARAEHEDKAQLAPTGNCVKCWRS